MRPLEENIDYYVDATGLLVFTEKYLLDRGYCCDNGCRHCPYKVTEGKDEKSVKPDSLHRQDTGNDDRR